MATPTRPPIGAPLQNLAPSSTFLQQLLEEINSTSIPTVLHRRATLQGTPYSRPSSDGSRRSSVWIGGSSDAQDAREKLRAADEARLLKSSVSNCGATSRNPTPALHLRIPCFDSPSSSDKSTATLSPSDASFLTPVSRRVPERKTRAAAPDATGSSYSRPTVGGLYLPVLSTYAAEPLLSGDIAGSESPLMFCDVDSNMSTVSPIEPPTSATSATCFSTNATTVSDDRARSPAESGNHSPNKRARSGNASPEMLSKRLRTMTLPVISGPSVSQCDIRTTPWRRSIGGDNRRLVRESNFIERGPALVEHSCSFETNTLPELSSFRPQAADPQGVPPRPATPIRSATRRSFVMEQTQGLEQSGTPIRSATRRSSMIGREQSLEEAETPIRSGTRRSSMIEQDQSPKLADTPIYARSLHLIDTDISIYKKDHGDKWREHALCLYCFRRHGGFNKLREHGYEVCGRDEALESYYWESGGDDPDW